MQTATNPETGERLALVGGEWKPIESTATHPSGQKAYLIGGKWLPDSEFDFAKARAEAPPSNSILENIGPEAIKHAPEIGSILGGVGGTISGGPAGGLAGTALGASIGTSIRQIIERLRGGTQPITGPGGIVHEQAKNIVGETTAQMAGEGVGKVIGTAANKILPVPREGAGAAQAALAAKGGSLSGAQAVDSPTINLAESIARSAAGGKGKFLSLEANNARALQEIKNDLVESISAAPVNDRVAGKLFQSAIGKGEEAHKVAAKRLYATFDQQAGGLLVDSSPVSSYGKTLVDEMKQLGNVGKTDAGGRLMDQLASVPNTLTFSQAHELRSNLLALIRDLKASSQPESKAIATATGALKQVEAQMDAAAQSASPQLWNQYRDISRFYRTGKEAFNNEVVASLMRANPERVGEELFKVGNVSEIIQAKASLRQAALHDKSVDPKDAFSRLQAGYLNAKLSARGATDKLGETTAQNLLKDLAEAKTDRQFAVMFTPQQRDAIDDFARTAYLALNNKPKNFGVLTSMLQAAAIGDLAMNVSGSSYTTKSPATDLAVIFGPSVMAKVLVNPKAVSILSRGLKLPEASIGSPIAAKLTADFVAAMNDSEHKTLP